MCRIQVTFSIIFPARIWDIFYLYIFSFLLSSVSSVPLWLILSFRGEPLDFFFGDDSILANLRKKRKAKAVVLRPAAVRTAAAPHPVGNTDRHAGPAEQGPKKRWGKVKSSKPAPAPELAAPDRSAVDITLLVLFVLFGYFVRKALFTGMVWSDDYDYAQLAVMIIEGRYNPVDIGPYNLYAWRFVMIYPLAFFFKLFGSTSENVAVIWPMISSLATAVLLYVIGRKLFDSKTGLVAAALHLLYPSDILFSTSVLTETPFNLVIALSVLLFVFGEDDRRPWVKLPLFFIVRVAPGAASLRQALRRPRARGLRRLHGHALRHQPPVPRHHRGFRRGDSSSWSTWCTRRRGAGSRTSP